MKVLWIETGESWLCCRTCFTDWNAGEDLRAHYPPRHSDYRDTLPLDLKSVYDLYKPYVREGAWTFGLFEMWFPKAKPVKHSVHIPCWDSFKWLPWKWRHFMFGRSWNECFYTGVKGTRWARGAYAAALGREYIMPVVDISKHGKGFRSDIKALCIMYCAMGEVFSCGIGQLLTCCGSFLLDFGACYSCHSREKIRRKYKLPPTCGMPPGIDDCLVHFFCAYCASHQELRELAVRGVDGPGMHIFDVLPDSWNHVEGHAEALAARQALVARMLAQPPRLFKPRKHERVEWGPARFEAEQDAEALKLTAEAAAEEGAVDLRRTVTKRDGLEVGRSAPSVYVPTADLEASLARYSAASYATTASSASVLGWAQYRDDLQPPAAPYCAPTLQEMGRCVGEAQAPGRLARSWSVAY